MRTVPTAHRPAAFLSPPTAATCRLSPPTAATCCLSPPTAATCCLSPPTAATSKFSRRTGIAGIAALPIAFALAALLISAQVPPPEGGPGGEPAPPATGDPAAPPANAANPAIPPIPEWTPTDPELLAQFTEARKHLDERRYDESKKLLKRLKSKAKGTGGEAAVERCLLEAEGGILCEKAGEHAKKGQHRQVIRLFVEDGKPLAGTFTGAELQKFHDEAFAEIFETLADFEPAAAGGTAPEGGGEGGEGGAGGGGPGGNGGAGRGATSYGANSRLITGAPEEGEVRNGKGALYWQLTAQLGVLQVEIPEDLRLEDYRYLRLSIRAEEPDAEPPVLLIFDCEAGNFAGPGAGMGPGRRAGGWAVAAVHRRIGFHHTITPGARYQDLRLDLRKFEEKGNPKWGNVLYLRLVHLGGAAETGVFLDDLILEKE